MRKVLCEKSFSDFLHKYVVQIPRQHQQSQNNIKLPITTVFEHSKHFKFFSYSNTLCCGAQHPAAGIQIPIYQQSK